MERGVGQTMRLLSDHSMDRWFWGTTSLIIDLVARFQTHEDKRVRESVAGLKVLITNVSVLLGSLL